MKNNFFGTPLPPPAPQKKAILGGQKGKRAVVGAKNIRYDLGWGTCFKVTLQNPVQENFFLMPIGVLAPGGTSAVRALSLAAGTNIVSIVLGIIFLSFFFFS